MTSSEASAPDGSLGTEAGAPDASTASHSPCIPGGALDPASDPCASTLCVQGDDFYCCQATWDLSCVATAHILCPSECPGGPDDGGVGGFGGTAHSMTQITSRDGAECAVSVEGDVWCWGLEDILGDGSEQTVPFPRKLVGLPVATRAVAMAGDGICALGVDDGVRCWGRAPVASTTTTPVVTPPSTPYLSSASAIAGDRILGQAGSSFVCALVSGGVECWGAAPGTLGPGVLDPTSKPTSVQLEEAGVVTSPVTAVAAGGDDTCLLVGDAGVPLCWGANTMGMLGHAGSGDSGAVPVTCLPANGDGGGDDCANAMNGVVKVSVGATSLCVLKAGGQVLCLGDNTSGQLGIGTDGGSFPYPQPVAGLSATDISIGVTHACAAPLDASAPVVCWGSGANGQLGPGGGLDGGIEPSPVAVPGLSGVKEVTASAGVTCALKSDGTVWCWGTNANGQLGNGATGGASAVPTQVPFVSYP